MKPRKKAKPYGAVKASSSAEHKLLIWILQLSLVSLSRCLSAVSAPFGRLLCVQLFVGRSCGKLLTWLKGLVFHLVAWFCGPAVSRNHWIQRWSRSYGVEVIRRCHVVLGLFVAAGVVSSLVRRWRERFDARAQQISHIKARMQAATSYQEWRELAEQLDNLDANRLGGRCGIDEARLYDKKLLQQKLAHLQQVREGGNIREVMFNLRSDLIRNVANIAKSQLHEHSYTVPSTIRSYISEVQTQLSMLTDWPEAGVSNEEKLNFFREVRHTYGRTALLLSGGGGLGSFHIGIVKALFEHRMLPRVLAGSSVGSIVAGIIATRTDDELRETFSKLEQFDISFFNNSRAVELVHHFLARGVLHDMGYLQRKLQQLVGHYTFLEAYERTGRILNVSVCPADTNEPPRLLNYLTAPQALIWSAVAASSAFPGLFQPQDILARNARGEEVPFNSLAGAGAAAAAAAAAPGAASAASERRWRDGSLELDLPTFHLAEMFNCNHFIVSQCNPHIVPLLNFKKTLSRKWANLFELELRHKCLQAQALLSDVIPTKWLMLFTQPWEGDITIVLPSALWNVGKSITNPTTEDLVRATKLGELHVWEKLSAIEAHCAVEATLDACLARLTNKARERPLSGLSARIPSWLCMSGVGQQAVASWGNPLQASASALWGPGGWRSHSVAGSLDRLAGNGSSGGGAAPRAAGCGAAAGGAPAPGSSEAMAAAAAAAMAGQGRLAYYHPAAGQVGSLTGGAGLLGAYHYPNLHSVAAAPGADRGRVPRVPSWGSDAIADSVADFPADAAAAAAAASLMVAGPASGGHHHHHHHHHSPRSARHRACGAAGGGSDPATPRGGAGGASGSGGRGGGSGAASLSGASVGSARSSSSAGSRTSSGVDPSVVAGIDCCDATVTLDLWSGLLPLSTAAVALEAAADGEGLDYIAP